MPKPRKLLVYLLHPSINEFARQHNLSASSLRHSNTSCRISRRDAEVICAALGISLEEFEAKGFTLTKGRCTYGKGVKDTQLEEAFDELGLSPSQKETEVLQTAIASLRPLFSKLNPAHIPALFRVVSLNCSAATA